MGKEISTIFNGGALTRPGLDYGTAMTPPFVQNQQPARVFFDTSDQAMQKANTALNAGPNQDISYSNGNLQFTPRTNLPKFIKPTLRQEMTDENGNTKPISSGETKLGKLMHILGAAARGGTDAIAGGALDAPRNGESSFGKGFSAAQQMPLVRIAQRQQQQRFDAEQRQRQQQEQIANTPVDIGNGQMVPYAQAKPILDIQESQLANKLREAQISASNVRGQTPEEASAAKARIAAQYGFKQGSPEFNEIVFGIKPQKPDTNVSEFEAWQKQNPNAPVSDYYRMRNTFRQVGGSGNANGNASETDIKLVASSLTDPKSLTSLREIASMRGDQRLKVFAEAKRMDPTFDPGLVNHRIKFLQSYEDPKGRAAINRQAINNILQHASDLRDLNDQYRARSEFRPLNTPINSIARAIGSEAYTKFATVNSVLKDELALYFAGGYAPSQDQQAMWNKIQSDEATPAQTEEFAREVARLGFRRANTFAAQFRKNMGYDDPEMLTPEAVNAAERLGLKDEVEKFTTGGQHGGAGTSNTDRPSRNSGKDPAAKYGGFSLN